MAAHSGGAAVAGLVARHRSLWLVPSISGLLD